MQLQPRFNETGYSRFYRFYGVELFKGTHQLSGECPFLQCQSEDHSTPTNFFANPQSGLWDCKKCGRSGNAYEFIRYLYDDALSQTTEEDYETLAASRTGISVSTLKHFGLAYNYLNDEWLIPTFSLQRQKLVNLYAWKQEATTNGPVMTVMSGPMFKNVMFGLTEFRKDRTRPIWVAEGPWDFMATWELFHAESPTGKQFIDAYDVLGMPGTTIPDEDASLFLGREIISLGDNDLAGSQMVQKLVTKLCKRSMFPTKVSYLDWEVLPTETYKHRLTDGVESFPPGSTANPPKGYDVRDLIIDQGSNDALDYLLNKHVIYPIDKTLAASTNYDPRACPVPCDNFDEVIESCKQALFMPDCLYDTLAVMFAIASTVSMKSHPLWSYIVGPPSSGKTTLLSLISAAQPYCFGMTTWTGLISGYVKDGMGDASLLPKVDKKCITIEDLTPLLNEPKPTQDRLFGELRDVYEGKTAKYYRNYEHRVFDGFKFHILACVTDRIRSINNTDLGERFLHVDQDTYWRPDGSLVRDGVDKKHLLEHASNSVLDEIGEVHKIPNLIEQKSICWGFMEHIINRIKEDKSWIQTKTLSYRNSDMPAYVEGLSNWIAYARTVVQRDREKHLLFRPRIEYGSRVMKQLTKLAIALSLIFDESFPSERVKGIIRKVALDSGYSFQQEIMTAICHSPGGLTVNEISGQLNIPPAHSYARLRDMQELGIVCSRTLSSRTVGQPAHYFCLTKETQSLAEAVGFGKPKPPPRLKLKIS